MTTRRTVCTLLASLPLLRLPEALAALSAGEAPDFTLESRAGGPVSLAGLRGQVVLVNFWATWCAPCRQEMPLLDAIYRRYEPMGFTLLGVNVEPDSRLSERFLRDTPVTFPILFDPEERVSRLYSVAAMPSTVIIDRKGVVRYIHHGYKPGDENKYQDSVRTLIRERA
jgi:peroxiredoxin